MILSIKSERVLGMECMNAFLIFFDVRFLKMSTFGGKNTKWVFCLCVPVISCWEDYLCSLVWRHNSHRSAICGRGCAFYTFFHSWQLPSLRRKAMTATRCRTLKNMTSWLCRCSELDQLTMSPTLSSETSRWPPSPKPTNAYIFFMTTLPLIQILQCTGLLDGASTRQNHRHQHPTRGSCLCQGVLNIWIFPVKIFL